MVEIPVTYLCWGCGCEITVVEETDVAVPSMEIWNLCPNCQGEEARTEKEVKLNGA